jgi:hypothetical protein
VILLQVLFLFIPESFGLKINAVDSVKDNDLEFLPLILQAVFLIDVLLILEPVNLNMGSSIFH